MKREWPHLFFVKRGNRHLFFRESCLNDLVKREMRYLFYVKRDSRRNFP